MQLPAKLSLHFLDTVQRNLILQPLFCALECLVFAALASSKATGGWLPFASSALLRVINLRATTDTVKQIFSSQMTIKTNTAQGCTEASAEEACCTVQAQDFELLRRRNSGAPTVCGWTTGHTARAARYETGSIPFVIESSNIQPMQSMLIVLTTPLAALSLQRGNLVDAARDSAHWSEAPAQATEDCSSLVRYEVYRSINTKFQAPCHCFSWDVTRFAAPLRARSTSSTPVHSSQATRQLKPTTDINVLIP